MSTSEIFLIAMVLIFLIPYVTWRVGRTEYYAPLVVVQIITGILLGPGILGALYPHYYAFVFNPAVVQALNGIAWWAVMSFVWIAGIELDLGGVWRHRRESSIAAGLALGTPLLTGCAAAMGLVRYSGWIGPNAAAWQFVLGIGMACAVTALPILILFMEKLQILRQPIGQRILRYASMDDVAIWGVLALILMDWHRMGKQLTFLVSFAIAAWAFRRLMVRLPERDRWYVGLIWLAAWARTGRVCISWWERSCPAPSWMAIGSIRSKWTRCGRMCSCSSCRCFFSAPDCVPPGRWAVPR
jgi:Kef-type K+ transport system membrane component KefB